MAAEPGFETALPMLPETGEELAAVWNIKGEMISSYSVQVVARREGSREVELLDSFPMSKYNLRSFAQRFGPGDFILKPGPRSGLQKGGGLALNVSERYALDAGWKPLARVPEHTVASVMGAQALVDAAMTPIEKQAMVEHIVGQVVDRLMPKLPPPPPAADPIEQMNKFFNLFQTIQSGVAAKAAPAAVEMPWYGALAEKTVETLGPLVAAGAERLKFAPQKIGRAHV